MATAVAEGLFWFSISARVAEEFVPIQYTTSIPLAWLPVLIWIVTNSHVRIPTQIPSNQCTQKVVHQNPSGPLELVFDSKTCQHIEERSRRRLFTQEEKLERFRLKEVGGACAVCKKGKRKVSHWSCGLYVHITSSGAHLNEQCDILHHIFPLDPEVWDSHTYCYWTLRNCSRHRATKAINNHTAWNPVSKV